MILLDTDMMSLFASGDPAVVARVRTATEPVATTIVTRIEILRGRFDFLLKAANAEQLQRAQSWLLQSERDLAKIRIVAIDPAAAAGFEDLLQHKKLRKKLGGPICSSPASREHAMPCSPPGICDISSRCLDCA
jgi:tRNA(fMet)-specific endonuclease VapC